MGEDWRHILLSKGGVAVPNDEFSDKFQMGGPGVIFTPKIPKR